MEEFIRKHGTPVSVQDIQLINPPKPPRSFEKKRGSSQPTPSKFTNLNEFTGDLEFFYQNQQVQYFIVNDVPRKLSRKKAILHSGVTLVFARLPDP